MRSIRFRLLAAAAAGTLLVLSTSWVALYVLVRGSLLREFDTLLGAKARSLAALVEQDGSDVELEFDEDGGLEEFRREERPEYFQVWDANGGILARSRSLAGGDLDLIVGPPGVPSHRSIALPDGRPGRATGISFLPRVDGRPAGDDDSSRPRRLTLVVARETADIDRTLASLRIILVSVGSLATAISLVALAMTVRRGLRPLNRIATQIRNVGENDLAARIDLANVPAELAPIGERLNELLARLEAAFERERAFSANLSHELRTPLAGIRSTLEVGLAGRRDPDAYGAAMRDSLAICAQVQRMIENLLSLARLEAGRTSIERGTVRLDELVEECWSLLEPTARERGLAVEYAVEKSLLLRTDREKLRLVLHNLLENAVCHADAGGRVRVQARSADARVQLRISNSGSRQSREEVERVFERFWRGDAARPSTGVHFGLGLPLCRMVVDALNGSIAVESERGGDFVVAVSFDATGPAAPGTG